MTETFQISAEQAEIYETRFVPAIFAQWTEPLLDLAGVRSGARALDVACGTGVLARAARRRVGPSGAVTGVDLNDGMLSVARRIEPSIHWQRSDVASLPFADATFDAVLCQSALMFFPDVVAALREMARVCSPSGRVGLQVYASLADQPAYGPWTDMVASHAGPEARRLLGTYWSQGDRPELDRSIAAAGLRVTASRSVNGAARFASIQEMVATEINGTPLVDRITDETRRRILSGSEEILNQYRTLAGVEVPIVAHLVVAEPAHRPRQ